MCVWSVRAVRRRRRVVVGAMLETALVGRLGGGNLASRGFWTCPVRLAHPRNDPRIMAYTDTGVGAVRGEAEKRRSWDAAMLRHAEAAPAGVEFIPFSLEASGVWGPAARRFFAKCLYLADDDRDIDVYPTYYLPCLVLGSWFLVLYLSWVYCGYLCLHLLA